MIFETKLVLNSRTVHLHGDMRDYAWGPGGLDTIISQLLNQLENTGPPPASEDQLRNLPVVTIGQEELGLFCQQNAFRF